jgi:hypothetical protein
MPTGLRPSCSHNPDVNPNHFVLTTTDSHVWGGASGYNYTFTHLPNGTTDIDIVVVREGKSLKGACSASCCEVSATRLWVDERLCPGALYAPSTMRKVERRTIRRVCAALPA